MSPVNVDLLIFSLLMLALAGILAGGLFFADYMERRAFDREQRRLEQRAREMLSRSIDRQIQKALRGE